MIFAALGAALLYAVPVLLAARGVDRVRAISAGLAIAIVVAAVAPPSAAVAVRPGGVQAALGNFQRQLQPLNQPPATASPAPNAAPRPTPTPPKLPRLRIPSIKVDAWLGQVGIDSTGNIDAPKSGNDVAWYRFSVPVGSPGNAIVDGHVDWYDNAQGVFWNLDRVHTGDVVTVLNENGTSLEFVIDSVSLVDTTAHPGDIYSKQGAPSLTLITCGGRWDAERKTYLSRVLVRSHLRT